MSEQLSPDSPAPLALTANDLGGGHWFFTGPLPNEMKFDAKKFIALWALHPVEYHEIMMRGRLVKTPRWQQAFGMDYHYTGRINKAMPVPPLLEALLAWAKASIHARLNGLLCNYYEGKLGHYIGPHRDSTKNMVEGAPIVTVSLGEERVFRIRPWKQKGAAFRDFPATDGSVFVTPYATNLAFTHEVPHAARYTGRRISVTLRAFE